MRNMTFGGFLAGLCTIIGLLCFIGAVSDAAEPKCIVTGCSNKRAPESSYCYLTKPYRDLIQVLTRRGVRAAVHPRPTESHREAAYPDHPAIKAAVLPAAALQHPEALLPTASRKVLMEPAATEKAQRIPTTTDTMTSIWTGITTMTVMPGTATTRMASMMRWTSWGMIRKTAEKIANHVWRYEITDGI